jgi:hypothetical protein
MRLCRGVPNGEFAEKARPAHCQIRFHSDGDGPLDGREIPRNRRLDLQRPGEQVNVFGHEHEGNEVKSKLLGSAVDAFSEIAAPLVVREQGSAFEGRERELMKIARFVDVLHQFAARRHLFEGNWPVHRVPLASCQCDVPRVKAVVGI